MLLTKYLHHVIFHLVFLNSPGVMPVRRRKYLEKNEGLAKCISSAICAADLSVCNDIKRITNLNNLKKVLEIRKK